MTAETVIFSEHEFSFVSDRPRGSKMNEHRVYKIGLKATASTFLCNRVEVRRSFKREPSASIDEAVAHSIIGYWVDLVGQDSQILYRKFLHHLPLNLPDCWSQWGKRKQKKAIFSIEVPEIANAQFIKLYEQKFTSPSQSTPERQQHFQLSLLSPAGI